MTSLYDFKRHALKPAFRQLRRGGIYASMRYVPCCQTCGHGELSGRPHFSSYLFFHVQCLDRLEEGWDTLEEEGLHLYHHFEDEATAGRAVKTLRRFVRVEWDGGAAKAMVIRPMTPGDAPGEA